MQCIQQTSFEHVYLTYYGHCTHFLAHKNRFDSNFIGFVLSLCATGTDKIKVNLRLLECIIYLVGKWYRFFGTRKIDRDITETANIFRKKTHKSVTHH